jgi:hypothetical protein
MGLQILGFQVRALGQYTVHSTVCLALLCQKKFTLIRLHPYVWQTLLGSHHTQMGRWCSYMVTVSSTIWYTSNVVCLLHSNKNSMCHHHAVGNLTYSHAMCVWPLVPFTRCFVPQIPACMKGHNLKTKDLQTHVCMNLHDSFWMYHPPL